MAKFDKNDNVRSSLLDQLDEELNDEFNTDSDEQEDEPGESYGYSDQYAGSYDEGSSHGEDSSGAESGSAAGEGEPDGSGSGSEGGSPHSDDDDPEEMFSGDKALWYVVHTYSGHESKVKLRIDKKVKSRGLKHLVQDIVIPTEIIVETKNRNSKLKNKKLYPGYVIVKMVLTNETWYLIRNTEGVTGFVGHGSAPVPLTDEEVRNMGIDNYSIDYDIDVGDYVRIVDGNFKNYTGTVEQVNKEKKTVKLITTGMVTINCELSLLEKLN